MIIIKPSVLNVPVNFVLVPGPITPAPILAIPGIPGNPAGPPVIPPIPPIPGTVFYQATDTPDIIAANYATAISGILFTKVTDGNVLVYDNFEPIDTATTDPQSQIVHGATIGQFISLPTTGAGLIDGEQVRILSPFGNVTIRFVERGFAGRTRCFTLTATGAAVIQSRLQGVLPTYSRAIVTNTGTLGGPVVQILGATDIIPLDGASLIQTGPNAYSRKVLKLDIKNGDEIRNGEQIEISVDARRRPLRLFVAAVPQRRRRARGKSSTTIPIWHRIYTIRS